MKRRTSVILHCLGFVFFLTLAINSMREVSILNEHLFDTTNKASEDYFELGAEIADNQFVMAQLMNCLMEAHGDIEKLHNQVKTNDINIANTYELFIRTAELVRNVENRLMTETVMAYPQVIAEAMPSIVEVNTENQYGQKGGGSGFIIDAVKGYVVTAAHCTDLNKLSMYGNELKSVTLSNGKTVNISKVFQDPNDDISVIVLDTNDPNFVVLPTLTITKTELVRGDVVLALGRPWGYKHSATAGIVSNPEIKSWGWPDHEAIDRLQFDTASNPGNSGGPLVNLRGEVVGVVVSGHFGDMRQNAGVNFAVSIESLHQCLGRFDEWLAAEQGFEESVHINYAINN